MRTSQGLLKLRNPAIEKFQVEAMIDDRIFQQLDGSGFIDQLANM